MAPTGARAGRPDCGKNAVGGFRFEQQREARCGPQVNSLARSERRWRRGRPCVASRVLRAPHVDPVVRVLGATQSTTLVVSAVSGPLGPLKLVGAQFGHRACPLISVLQSWFPGLPGRPLEPSSNGSPGLGSLLWCSGLLSSTQVSVLPNAQFDRVSGTASLRLEETTEKARAVEATWMGGPFGPLSGAKQQGLSPAA